MASSYSNLVHVIVMVNFTLKILESTCKDISIFKK